MPTKYQLCHNDRIVVFENRLHSENPMLYRPTLHGNWNALSLARRALKNKFPTPTVPLTTVLQNRRVFLPDSVYACMRILLRHEYVYGSGGKTPRKFNCLSVSYTQPIWTAWWRRKQWACRNQFPGAFAKLRRATISFVMSFCLSLRSSVRPHGTTRLPLDSFSLNFIFEYFSKIGRKKWKFH